MNPSVHHLEAASLLFHACLSKGLFFTYDGSVLVFRIPVRGENAKDVSYVPCSAVIGGDFPDSIEHLNHLIAAVAGLVSP